MSPHYLEFVHNIYIYISISTGSCVSGFVFFFNTSEDTLLFFSFRFVFPPSLGVERRCQRRGRTSRRNVTVIM